MEPVNPNQGNQNQGEIINENAGQPQDQPNNPPNGIKNIFKTRSSSKSGQKRWKN